MTLFKYLASGDSWSNALANFTAAWDSDSTGLLHVVETVGFGTETSLCGGWLRPRPLPDPFSGWRGRERGHCTDGGRGPINNCNHWRDHSSLCHPLRDITRRLNGNAKETSWTGRLTASQPVWEKRYLSQNGLSQNGFQNSFGSLLSLYIFHLESNNLKIDVEWSLSCRWVIFCEFSYIFHVDMDMFFSPQIYLERCIDPLIDFE